MRRFGFVSLALFVAVAALSMSTRAEDPKPVKHPAKTAQKKKRRGEREKETEGTEAPDRFQADTVIKSQYKLHGEPLEVDPD